MLHDPLQSGSELLAKAGQSRPSPGGIAINRQEQSAFRFPWGKLAKDCKRVYPLAARDTALRATVIHTRRGGSRPGAAFSRR
jgi:hypothetical protein